MEVELNMVFRIKKGKRELRWKIINHPNFDSAYALVRDHSLLTSGIEFQHIDKKYTVAGGTTLEKVYQMAYSHT